MAINSQDLFIFGTFALPVVFAIAVYNFPTASLLVGGIVLSYLSIVLASWPAFGLVVSTISFSAGVVLIGLAGVIAAVTRLSRQMPDQLAEALRDSSRNPDRTEPSFPLKR